MSLWVNKDDQPADSRKMMERPDANSPTLTVQRESGSAASENRRTTRLSIAVPVTVTGKDAAGEAFQEETNTLNISKHGALLALHRRVAAGSELTIENRFLEVSIRARVVSFRNRISPADPDHVGIELTELKNIWGIRYPPRDWLLAIQGTQSGSSSPTPPATKQPSPHPAPAGPNPAAVLNIQARAKTPTTETAPTSTSSAAMDPEAFEKQAGQSAEALLKTFGAKLAKLGAQMGARIQSGLKEAADRVEEKEQRLSALDERLGNLSQTLEGTLDRAETAVTAAQKLGQRSAEETQHREEEFHRQLQRMFASSLEDFDRRINQRVLASTVAQKEQHSRLQQETVESLKEIQDRMCAHVETISKEVLAGIPEEIEHSRAEAVSRISSQAEEKLEAAIQRFEQRLESLIAQTQEAASERVKAETLARLTPELEAREAQTLGQAQDQIKQSLDAALGQFEERLQTTALESQKAASERLKSEALSKLLPELVARQVETIDQTLDRVRQTLEVSLIEFQQRLQATATHTQEAASEKIKAEALATLLPELEARHGQAFGQAQDRIKEVSEAALIEFEQQLQATTNQAQETITGRLSAGILDKLTPQLEARQAETIGQAQDQVKQTLEGALRDFERHLQVKAAQAQETASERMKAEAISKLLPELGAFQAQTVGQTQNLVMQSLDAALGEFEQRLQNSATEAHEIAAEKLKVEMLARLAPELETRQAQAVGQAQDSVKQNLEVVLSEFGQRLETTAARAQELASERLKAETLSRLLPEFESHKAQAVDQAQDQVKQILESALDEFERQLQATAEIQRTASEQLKAETLANLTPELEARGNQVIEQAQNRAKGALESALDDFEQRLQAAAAETQGLVSERMKAETLSRLLPELEARQAQTIVQTQDHVKQTLEAALGEFEQRLQAAASQAQQAASDEIRQETISKLAPELEAHRSEAIEQARISAREALQASLDEFEQKFEVAASRAQETATERLSAEILDKLTPQLEARQQRMLDQTHERAQQKLNGSLGNFEQQLQASANQAQEAVTARLTQEILTRVTPQFQASQSEAVQQTREQVNKDVGSALALFQQELRTASAEVGQAATERLRVELAAKLAPQLETHQAEAVEQTRKRITDDLHSSFGEFEQRLQAAATQTERTSLEKLRAEILSSLAPELLAYQAQTFDETQGQVRQSLEAALSEFRQQLDTAAAEAQETTTERLSSRILDQLTPQLEARQAETLDETRKRGQQALENSLGQFHTQLQAAALEAREAAAQRLSEQFLGQLTPQFESHQKVAVHEAQARVQETIETGLADFERRLQAAAVQTQQAALEKLTEETQVKLTPVLAAHQLHILDGIRTQVAAEIENGVQSLRNHVESKVNECQKAADSLLQKPSDLLRRYAEDTIAMLREEIIEERKSAIESTKIEVRAMMRSTLTSLNEEATAFTGEFREQVRSSWEGMKSRGLEELEALHKEAMEQHRESVLKHLQKDAEDLTHVAVGQFRSQSAEAIRDANDAINKQVGAAAFLLKDWMDQATTRLERCLEKVETRAETAFEAAQTRSLKMQMAMMERVHRESEQIALELHDRFQQAASALRGTISRIPDVTPGSSGAHGEESNPSPAHLNLER